MSYEDDIDPADPSTFEPQKWECEMCWGQVMLIGCLGLREHGSCRSCGAEQSRLVTPEQGDMEREDVERESEEVS